MNQEQVEKAQQVFNKLLEVSQDDGVEGVLQTLSVVNGMVSCGTAGLVKGKSEKQKAFKMQQELARNARTMIERQTDESIAAMSIIDRGTEH